MKSKEKSKKLKRKDLSKFILFVVLALFGFYIGINVDKLKTKSLSLLPSRIISENFSARELKESLSNKNFTLVNVHTPYEGEIEKTDMFIEYDSMMASKNMLPQDKNARIVLYCKTGRMSTEALETLRGMGYTNVSHLKGGMDAWREAEYEIMDLSKLPEEVLPEAGFELPVVWGDVGPRLIELGVIDLAKLEKAVNMTDEQKEILTSGSDQKIKIDMSNGQFIVDVLWALGLAQKSKVYQEGPLGTEYKDKAGSFASTGGWSLAKGDAVNYLGKFDLIPLTNTQQEKVSEIAKNVYRPCCGNSTWFPDCNHGMAALAAIELMVSEGLSDEEIYKNVLALNSFWFPSSYLTAATYFARQGVSWDEVDAKEVLGQEYSSGQGAGEIFKKVGPLPYELKGVGGSCGA